MLENAQTPCHDVYVGSLCSTWHISTATSLECNCVQSLLLITDLNFGTKIILMNLNQVEWDGCVMWHVCGRWEIACRILVWKLKGKRIRLEGRNEEIITRVTWGVGWGSWIEVVWFNTTNGGKTGVAEKCPELFNWLKKYQGLKDATSRNYRIYR
jgi:hypothetical protein